MVLPILFNPSLVTQLHNNCENINPLDVEIYTLENGLTVMLNEDRNETSVFGAVAVSYTHLTLPTICSV